MATTKDDSTLVEEPLQQVDVVPEDRPQATKTNVRNY